MILRSLLFVPADSEKKLAKASAVPADALILDLEDSVARENRPRARELAREFLSQAHRPAVWVRINPLGSEDFIRDVEAVVARRPAGLVVPKAGGPQSLREIDSHVSTREAKAGVAHGTIR